MARQISPDINSNGFFAHVFQNARQNSVLVLDTSGTILCVNDAFVTSFGYADEDVVGKNHRLLFTEKDQQRQRPETEIETVMVQNSASDDCYLVHRDGTHIWVNGESILVKNEAHETYIAKIIHDIHSQKLLEKYLSESNELIDTIFGSVRDTALLVLDGQLNMIRANEAFYSLFRTADRRIQGAPLTFLDHPLWSDESMKEKLKLKISNQDFSSLPVKWKEEKSTRKAEIEIKLLEGDMHINRRLLLVISETG
jgi:PAS domain S-box-containing protein